MHLAVQLISLISCSIAVPVVQNDGGEEFVQIAGRSNGTTCNTGYHLSDDSCVANVCSCVSGTGSTGTNCPVDGTPVCVDCFVGHTLNGESCVKVFGCDELNGAEYRDTLFKIHSGNCSLPWNSVPNVFDAHSKLQYGIDSDYMRVWYFKGPEKITSLSGKALCEAHGLTLAQIHGHVEWKEAKAVANKDAVWIGAEHYGPGDERKDFKWMNGQNMCFDKWVTVICSNCNNRDESYICQRPFLDHISDDPRHPIYMYPGDRDRTGLFDDWTDDRKPLCEYRCTCPHCTPKTTDRGVFACLSCLSCLP